MFVCGRYVGLPGLHSQITSTAKSLLLQYVQLSKIKMFPTIKPDFVGLLESSFAKGTGINAHWRVLLPFK
jgi:hypothetical protein